MANYTPNYNLKKPIDSEYYDVADQNGNMDKIDTALNTLNSKLLKKSKYDTGISVPANDIASGDFDISSNPAESMFVVGFDISASTAVIPMQIYIPDKNTIHYRVRNVSSSAQTFNLFVYYC